MVGQANLNKKTIKTSTPGYWESAHVCIVCVLMWICVLCSVFYVLCVLWLRLWLVDGGVGQKAETMLTGMTSDQDHPEHNVAYLQVIRVKTWCSSTSSMKTSEHMYLLRWPGVEAFWRLHVTGFYLNIAVLLRATKPADAWGVVLLSNHSILLRR